MYIGAAVSALRNGEHVRRAGWNGKGMFLVLIEDLPKLDIYNSDEKLIEAVPVQDFVMMRTAQGTAIPWLCSQSDLLADDWEVIVYGDDDEDDE